MALNFTQVNTNSRSVLPNARLKCLRVKETEINFPLNLTITKRNSFRLLSEVLFSRIFIRSLNEREESREGWKLMENGLDWVEGEDREK